MRCRSSPDPLVVAGDARPLALANPVALIQGLRYLQPRIPGLTQLSVGEERSLIRVASLDPDFIEAGIRAGNAWSETKGIIGRSGEELRHEADEIRHWDEAGSEVRALLKGISAANRKRRHRLGIDILNLYMILGETIHGIPPASPPALRRDEACLAKPQTQTAEGGGA